MKKSILLDCDDVICFSGYLEAVNEFLNTNYVIDDFNDYFIDTIAIPEERFEEFTKFTENRNFYEKPVFIPYALETIEKLNEKYDIYICSACINPFNKEGSGRQFSDKYNFLIKYLPFLKPENFILTSAKHLFKADIQIDDRLDNFKNNDVTLKLLFPSYHNKEITYEELRKNNVLKAGSSWKTAWLEILNILNHYER